MHESIGRTVSNEKCSDANKELKDLLRYKNIQSLVVAQKWGGHEDALLDKGVNAYNAMILYFKKQDSSRKVFMLLDNPWDESKNREFDIEHFVPSRFNIKDKLPNLNVLVPLPGDDSWSQGNKFIVSKLQENVIFIDAEQVLCPNGKCNFMSYKDNDHLRASYVRENAVWIDQIFD